MTAEFKKRAYCHTCKKYLEDEFVEAHRALTHMVDFYVFGGYRKVEENEGDFSNEENPNEAK